MAFVNKPTEHEHPLALKVWTRRLQLYIFSQFTKEKNAMALWHKNVIRTPKLLSTVDDRISSLNAFIRHLRTSKAMIVVIIMFIVDRCCFAKFRFAFILRWAAETAVSTTVISFLFLLRYDLITNVVFPKDQIWVELSKWVRQRPRRRWMISEEITTSKLFAMHLMNAMDTQ